MDWGKFFATLVVGVAGIALLNKVATDPRLSPFWRKFATTAEGDIYQHIVSGAFVTVLG